MYSKVYKEPFFKEDMNEKEKVLADFIAYKKTSVNTATGIRVYLANVKRFIHFSNKPLSKYLEADLVNFVNAESQRYGIRTVNQIKVMVKNFIHWYYTDFSARFRNLSQICRPQLSEKAYKPEQMLSKQDIAKLVQGETDPRYKAFWLVLFYGGFRPGEVCKLEWSQIRFDKEGAIISVFVKKNHKTFYKFIPEDVCFYLRKIQNNNSKYVFPSRRLEGDVPIRMIGVHLKLSLLSQKVLGRRVNPYILRHSIATILYSDKTKTPEEVAQQMGHSKAMRDTYLNLSPEQIMANARRIWIKTEDMPEEKKHELEQKIKELEDYNFKVQEENRLTQNFMAALYNEIIALSPEKKKALASKIKFP